MCTQYSSSPSHIYVALSGGVDSAVSAALLKQQGYRVTGAFIKTWQPPFIECRAPVDREDARRVAAHLDIPFTTIDLEDTYKNEVADYMIEEYQYGRTPNPDVMCNRAVKFGAFLEAARERGADYIATGHYCRKTQSAKRKAQYDLREGKDKEKDQSYFLWMLTQEQLSASMFPIGDIEKSRTRELARELELPVATKKDSQGVCFIGEMDMKEFLSHYVEVEPGNVLNTSGDVIGRHEGAIFYTLGQRHGFEVTVKEPDEGPKYVLAKDMNANTITVGSEFEQSEYRINSIHIQNTNWISSPPQEKTTYGARVRYRQPKQNCTISYEESGNAVVHFLDPQPAPAVGQSLVLYDLPAPACADGQTGGERCLGGGIIESSR